MITSQWQGKKVAFLGDSITDKIHVGTEKNYWQYLEEKLGITPLVYGINGNRWLDTKPQAEKLFAEHGTDIDAIFIFMGTNDYMGAIMPGEWYSFQMEETNHGGNMVKRLRRHLNLDEETFCGRIVKDVENNRYKYKYDEYLMRSSFENPLIAENQFNISNNKYNVRFIQIPFSAADPSIEVSEDEIAEYYNSHMNHYRINDTRGIDYVIVELDDENYDAISEKADSVFADVKGIEEFRKAAEDNGYSLLATDMTMISNTLESVKNTANVTKWAFGKNVGSVSDPFTVVDDDEKSYLVVACVTKANDTGYAPMEEVAEEIKGYIAAEKAGDKLLAEVTEKVKGLNDLESMEEVLGVASIEKEMRFAVNDLDKRFAGAVSTAEKGIVNAPFKGSNSIYIYELLDSSVDSFYTDENVADNIMMVDAAYMNMYNYYLAVNQEFMITWNQYINNALSEQPVEVPDNVMTYLATYFPYDFILNPDLVKDYTSLHTSDI